MSNFDSTRSIEAILGPQGLRRLAGSQRDPAMSYRFECRRSSSSRFGTGGLFDRGLLPACVYHRYIRSSAWRASPARLAELAASGSRCRLCNSPDNTEVHHRTYARLGCELQSDLTTLCADCHRGVTSMLRERRFAATVPINTDVVLIGLRQRLLDPTREETER